MTSTASSSGRGRRQSDRTASLVSSAHHAPQKFAGYVRGVELGSGAFAKVYACHRASNAEERFAAKAVDLKKLRLSVDVNREMKKLLREAKILKKVPPHPNLVRFYDVVKEGEWLYFLLELVGGGNLFNTLIRRPGKRPRLMEIEARYVCNQLVDGLALLHDQGIIHRDLKPENVLVAQQRQDSKHGEVWMDVKITDFGLSKVVGERYSDAQSQVGSPRYMAPEVLAKGLHDFRADLWSLGVLMHVLLDGRFPCDERAARVPQNRLDEDVGKLPVSAQARALVLGLLRQKPEQRTTMTQLQQHPWLCSMPGIKIDKTKIVPTKPDKTGIVLAKPDKTKILTTASARSASAKSATKSASSAKPKARSHDAALADRGPSTKRRRLRYKQPPPPSYKQPPASSITWSVRSPIIENGFPPFGRDEELAIESAVSEVEQALASPPRPRTTLRRPALCGE